MPINPGDIMKELAAAKEVVAKLPVQIGAMARNHFSDNFDKEGWQTETGVEKWLPRKDKNNDRPTLTGKTAHLRNSLRDVTSGSQIRVVVTGPAAVYADIHNFGGVIKHHAMSRVINFQKAKGQKNWLKFAKNGAKRIDAQSRSTFKEHETKMPMRRFIGPSAALDRKIQAHIEAQLKKAIKTI